MYSRLVPLCRGPGRPRYLSRVLGTSSPEKSKWTRWFSIKSQDESVCPVDLPESIIGVPPSLESANLSVVKVPQLGKNLKQFKLHQWFKQPGEYIKAGELLCIIETDQIFGKVYSRVSGLVIENVCKEGSNVVVGGDLAVLLRSETSYTPYQLGDGTFSGKRKFSTLAKYKPMISFGKWAIPEEKLGTTEHNQSGPQVQFIEDFVASPYKHWVRNLSEKEIALVNHGLLDE